MGRAQGQQLGQGARLQVGPALTHTCVLSPQPGQPSLHSRFVHGHRGQLGHLLGRLQDGTVAGAAAQIAGEFPLGQLTGDGLARHRMVLVHGKQAHDEAGRAKAALRGMAVHQGLLHRVQGARRLPGGLEQGVAGEVFDCPQCQTIDGMGQGDAAVDGPVGQALPGGFGQHHGAGAAVALAAAFLGPSASEVFPEQL